MSSENKAFWCPIIIGVILIIAGFLIQIPGGALTTFRESNGKSTSLYVFDDKYSAIDEYVGGDAYNYIIGATLVSGKMSGAIISKTICIVGGVICLCFGITLGMFQPVLDEMKYYLSQIKTLEENASRERNPSERHHGEGNIGSKEVMTETGAFCLNDYL